MRNGITLSVAENKCLRECLKTIESILDGKGLILVGGASERKVDRKEPSQKQKVNNYAELLDSQGRYQKPKHLRK